MDWSLSLGTSVVSWDCMDQDNWGSRFLKEVTLRDEALFGIASNASSSANKSPRSSTSCVRSTIVAELPNGSRKVTDNTGPVTENPLRARLLLVLKRECWSTRVFDTTGAKWYWMQSPDTKKVLSHRMFAFLLLLPLSIIVNNHASFFVDILFQDTLYLNCASTLFRLNGYNSNSTPNLSTRTQTHIPTPRQQHRHPHQHRPTPSHTHTDRMMDKCTV